MIMQVPTLWLVWRYMPETKGLELEDIAETRGHRSCGDVAVSENARLKRSSPSPSWPPWP